MLDELWVDGATVAMEDRKEWLRDKEEQRVLFSALDSFRQYRKTAHLNVTHRRRQNFYALPASQWKMLAAPPFDFLVTLDNVDNAIDINAEMAGQILDTALPSFGVDPNSDPWRGTATSNDLDKSRSTIRQFYRDWSAEGADERNKCYKPVLEKVNESFEGRDRSLVKVLVPGAGLGRLMFEFCARGYTVEGNEISYHQLAASNWILNHIGMPKQHTLYPFALEFSNVELREHQFQKVEIPDVHVAAELQQPNVQSSLPASERMSMTAADFIFLYSNEKHRGAFNAVATVFFLDTAPNVIRYIETVYNCLEDGGIWVNLGPLLWHFADRGPGDRSSPPDKEEQNSTKSDDGWMGIEEPGSMELSNDEIMTLLERMGFQIEHEEFRQDGSGYIQNPQSMLQSLYRVSFWVARKKART